MSIVVDIIDTFPTRDTLAVGSVKIHSLLIVSGVMLKIDDESRRYYIQFPSNDGQAFIKLSDRTVKEKLYDAMVYQYEKYIMSLDFSSLSAPKEYIYRLERERIEKKYAHHYDIS